MLIERKTCSLLPQASSFRYPNCFGILQRKRNEVSTTSLTTGDETGLASILGWTGRKEEFLGPESFLRHQSITTIYSEHSYTRQKPTSDENAEETLTFTICSSARWMTYQYYAKDTGDDQTLGEMVKRTCGNADQPCVRPECKAKLRDHELRWVHHRTKIIGRVKPWG
jgi:1-phosphatidylinositol-3-phosphate 5-kinase